MTESRSNPTALLFGGLLVVVSFGAALFYATGQRQWQHQIEERVTDNKSQFAVIENRLSDIEESQATAATAGEQQDVKIQQIINAVNGLMAKNSPATPVRAPAVKPKPVETKGDSDASD